nr:hypothetical protein [Bryobacterales bacterium]
MRLPVRFAVRASGLLAGVLVLMSSMMGQVAYQKPSQEILDVLHAPLPPAVSVSPRKDVLLLLERLRYPSIATLAQPMLRLAGLRINPVNNGPHAAGAYTGITLMAMAGNAHNRVVALPAGSLIGSPVWSQTGAHFAFSRYTPTAIELWVGDVVAAKARKIDGIALNETILSPIQWMPDGQTLMVLTVPSKRGPAPVPPTSPTGPTVQESDGVAAPVRTYQDLLQNSHDEDLFEYLTTSQPMLVDAASNQATPWATPAIYTELNPAPDGQHVLVER